MANAIALVPGCCASRDCEAHAVTFFAPLTRSIDGAMNRFVLSLFAFMFGPLPAFAQPGGLPDNSPKVETSLIAERAGVAPGGKVTIALKEQIRKNWHTYWLNPGDAGAPTTVEWHLPPGWSMGTLQWPYPKRLPVGPLMNFGYEDEVGLLSEVSAPQDAQPGSIAEIGADVSWLVCSDVCIPENTHLVLRLPVTAAGPPFNAAAAPLFAATRAHLPGKSSWLARYDAADRRFALLLENPALLQDPPRSVDFYPYADGIVEAAAPQREEGNSDGLVVETAPGYKLASPEKRKAIRDVAGILVLTDARGQVSALDINATPGAVPASAPIGQENALPLLIAILFAFAGGLILNLMPCVFPVLSMKALALAAKPENANARASGLAYAAGAVLSFIALAAVLLAFRSAGAEIGWGFQLQQPLFVAILALLMFAIGLNLSGAYQIRFSANLGGDLAARPGQFGSFFTGVLAVLVATPCTAPFMGAAAGYALTADAPFALAVFAVLGLGFAAPFVVLSFAPALLRILPRPGPWMKRFRQFLAFPMYGAAVWLIWVLSLQAGSQGVLTALAAATVLAFALWLIGAREDIGTLGWMRSAAAMIALAGVGVLLAETAAGTPPNGQGTAPGNGQSISYEPFSAEKLAALQQSGRPVFVNATAAWCITCLVNEKLALSGGAVARAFASHNVAALKADWTIQDAAITALLARHGRSGVPLYLYFSPHAASPVVLPQLLTDSIVISAVENGG